MRIGSFVRMVRSGIDEMVYRERRVMGCGSHIRGAKGGVIMSSRASVGIWAGRVVAVLAVLGLSIYLYVVGLDRADKVSSGIGVVIALVALVIPYLLPPADAPSQPACPARTPTDEVLEPSQYRVDLRGAKGVQVNQSGGNHQTNTFSGSS
jgi:hypothetical protein